MSHTLVMGAMFVFFLFSWFQLQAQKHPKVSVGAFPNWYKQVCKGEHEPISSNEVNTGYCFQLLEYDINKPEQTTVTRIRKKVLGSEGLQACGNISITFDPTYQKLVIHSVQVIRNGNRIDRLSSKTFNVIQQERSSESYIYDGELTAFCILDDIRIGDEIEYAFSRVGRNPLEKGNYSSAYYMSYSEPIGEVSHRLTVSTKDSVSIRYSNLDIEPTISSNNGYRSYIWHVVNAKESKSDNESVHGYDPYARAEVSTYRSWGQVADWAIPHYDTSIDPDSELAKWIESEKSGNKSTEDLIRSAIRMVQRNVRYLGLEAGISAYKPHPVEEVFANKYGDCKDKSLLLVSILNQFGATAYPALVNTSVRDSLVNRLPSPYAFDHCIVVAEHNGKNIWIDPTLRSTHGPLDRITTPLYGKALVIKPDEADLVDVEIRATDAVETTETFTSEGFNSPVKLKVSSVYSGYSASRIRSYFESTTHSDISDSYLNYYASLYPTIELMQPFTFEDDSALNMFTVEEYYTVNDFWTDPDSTEDGTITCEFFAKTLSTYLNTPSDPIRTSRYKLSHPLMVRHVIIANLHEEWNITPATQKIQAPGLSYSSEISKSGKQLKMVYNLRSTRDYVEPTEIPSYMGKVDEIWNDLGYSLWHPGNSASEAEDWNISVWMILLAGFTVLLSSLGLWKLFISYDPQPQSLRTEARAFGGWLILPMIGLTLSPILMSYNVIEGAYFSKGVEYLLSSSSPAYNLPQGLLAMAELIWNSFFITFTVFCIVSLYMKRSSTPGLIIAFYAMNVFALGLDLLLGEVVGISMDAEDAKSLSQSIFGAAIWIPYFIKSERVKETFIQQLNPTPRLEPPPEEPTATALQP